jgi:hypothetical protein
MDRERHPPQRAAGRAAMTRHLPESVAGRAATRRRAAGVTA